MVHYVTLDTETDLGHGFIGPDEPGGPEGEDSGPFAVRNAQLNWLKKDLASVDRQRTPWIVVGMSSMRFSYDLLVAFPSLELLSILTIVPFQLATVPGT